MLAYAALTWLGMLVFGRAQWLHCGEAFALVFALLARFAPVEHRDSGSGNHALNQRSYGVGLLSREPASPSIVVLVLAMLAAVSFDGFMETPLWAAILEHYAPPAQDLGGDSDGRARSARAHSGPLCADAGTDRDRLPPVALAFLSRHGRAIADRSCLRSLRLRLGPVWHEKPFHQDRTGRR